MTARNPAATTWVHRLLAGSTLIVGLVTAAAAVLHIVAVIAVAYRDRGGYDARLADLLWIGWTSLICGALMIASSRGLRRGSRTAFRTAAGAAAAFLIGGLFLAPVAPGFWISAPLYGGYLLLAFGLRGRPATDLPVGAG